MTPKFTAIAMSTALWTSLPVCAALNPVASIDLAGSVDARGMAIAPVTGDLVVYDCDDDTIHFIEPAFDPGSGNFTFSVAAQVSVAHDTFFKKCLVTADPNSGLVYALVLDDRTTLAGQSWNEIEIHVLDGRSVVNSFAVNPDGGSPSTAPVDQNYEYNGLAIRPHRADGSSNARLVVHDTRGGVIDIVDLDATGTLPANIQRFDYRAPDTDSIRITGINLAVLDFNGGTDQLYIGDPNDPDNLGFALLRFTLQRGTPPNPVREPDIALSFTGTGTKGLFIDPAADRAYVTTTAQGLGIGNYVEVNTANQTTRTIDLPEADRGYVGIDTDQPGVLFIPTADLDQSDPPVILREFVNESEVDNATLGIGQFADPSPTVFDPRLNVVYIAEADSITVFSTGVPEGPFPNPDRASLSVNPPTGIDPGDRFGEEVAGFGGLVAAGSPSDADGGNTGSVTVYRREGTTLIEEAVLTTPPGFQAQGFGAALATSGELLIVGAPDTPRVVAKGLTPLQAAIFRRTQAGWNFVKELAPGNGSANDRFGSAVSIDGDMIAIGAEGDDEGEGGSGAAYLFEFDGANTVQLAKVKPPGGGPSDNLGRSVAFRNGKLAAGNPGGGLSGAGTVMLYRQIGGNLMTLGSAMGASGGDRFATAIALRGTTLVSGAPGADGDEGEVIVFDISNDSLIQRASLKANDPVAGGGFGTDVALTETFIAVGSPGALSSADSTGAGYLFSARGSFALLEKLLPESSRAAFASSVAGSSAGFILGAPDTDNDRGAAEFFFDSERVYRDGFE